MWEILLGFSDEVCIASEKGNNWLSLAFIAIMRNYGHNSSGRVRAIGAPPPKTACGYDGNFIPPDPSVLGANTTCHTPKACPASPSAPNNTHLVPILPTPPIKEFMPQKYQVEN